MMAAQTLETIPEETGAPAVAPATPRRVTSDVPKQTQPATAKISGRVASGKRLAKRNRLAREAKKNKPKRKRQLQAQQLIQTQVQQIPQQNNPVTTQATLFLELVV